MDLMFDGYGEYPEYEGDKYSFDDSDRFEDESICSWGSDPEPPNNWRGWKRQNQNGGQAHLQRFQSSGKFMIKLML